MFGWFKKKKSGEPSEWVTLYLEYMLPKTSKWAIPLPAGFHTGKRVVELQVRYREVGNED